MKLNATKPPTRRSTGTPPRLLFGFLTLVTVLFLSGCASNHSVPALAVLPDDGQNQTTVARAQQAIVGQFPPRYRATQRAIVTVGRQQYACDGVLTAAPDKGWQLAIVSSLGTVTGLCLKPDGACEILKVTPLFREDWSRRFVAEDLRRLFMPPADLKPAGRLADGRLVLQTDAGADGAQARYIFSAGGERWEELELVRDGHSYYRVNVRRRCAFAGVPGEIPCEFEVTAASHHLELRTTELSVSSTPGTEVVP